jgi:hypothetical protein
MKIFLLFLFIHLLAYSVVKAEEVATNNAPAAPVDAPKDDCRDLLPQIESDYKEVEQKYRSLNNGTLTSQESYLVSFNQMTQVLFKMVNDREEETAKISQSRDRLKNSVEQFNLQNTAENSKNLQDDYLDLTVRLYSTLMDAQKNLETLKSQLSQIETTRGQLETTRQEMEALDHQKLAMEGRLISLKIKCQDGKLR